jgi:hypothetical protein
MTSLLGNIVEGGRDIVMTHIYPIKVPKLLLVFPRVVLHMGTGVSVASGVSEPDIVTSTGGHEGGSDISIVHYPAVGWIKKTMLHQNWGLGVCSGFPNHARDAILGKDVAIISSNLMLLESESVLGAKLTEVTLAVTGIISATLCQDSSR